MKRVLILSAVFSAWTFHAQADEDFYLILKTNVNSLKYYKTEMAGSYSYRLLRATDEMKKEIVFESNHNYTSGYLNDKLLVLTNNNTEDSPCILIWDFATDQLKEDQILFSVKDHQISTYARSSVKCTADGGCIVRHPTRWHNDQWYETPTSILLRFGACIPNQCRVMWEYHLTNGNFSVFINTPPNQQQLPHQQKEIEKKNKQ